ncbi:MAG TPA: hypothetical protein VMH35_24255 [Streptosporangiaceae bacterium]|nr:hypothetical protein [Streptosporangiaceae bacterium]
MKRPDCPARTRTMPVLAISVAGLALAGCGGASSGSGSTGSGSSASPATAGGTVSAPAIFPATVGDTWVYQEKLTSMHGTVTNQVASVSPNPGGGEQVIMKSRDDLAGIPHAATRSTFVIHPDGSITVPLTQVGSSTVTVKSGRIIWPSAAQLSSGRPYASTLLVAFTEAGHALRVRANMVVRGAGTQPVHVPAGTYQATVINETMTEKVMGFKVTMDIRTWLAPGVGPVKSEVITKQGPLSSGIASEQVLKSFTRG